MLRLMDYALLLFQALDGLDELNLLQSYSNIIDLMLHSMEFSEFS